MTEWWPAVLMTVLAVVGGAGVLLDRHWREPQEGYRYQEHSVSCRDLAPSDDRAIGNDRAFRDQTTATLLGTIVGYVLSGIGKDEGRSAPKK